MSTPNQAKRNPQEASNDLEQSGNKKSAQASDSQNNSKKRHMDGDRGKVGQDTDGDGKVVKPGQTPGQSHGRGLDPSVKPNTAEPGRKAQGK